MPKDTKQAKYSRDYRKRHPERAKASSRKYYEKKKQQRQQAKQPQATPQPPTVAPPDPAPDTRSSRARAFEEIERAQRHAS